MKRNVYGYILSASSIIVFLNLGISIIAAAIVQGLETGDFAYAGIAAFAIFTILAIGALGLILKNIDQTSNTIN